LGTVLLSVGIWAAVFGLSSPTSVYARSVSEFAAHPIYDQRARVYGNLVPGSLCRQDHPCAYRFRLADRGSQLSVHYNQCLLPDTFRPRPGTDLRLTVEGSLCSNCHQFEASQVFAKMSGKYEYKQTDSAVEPSNVPNIVMPACPNP